MEGKIKALERGVKEERGKGVREREEYQGEKKELRKRKLGK